MANYSVLKAAVQAVVKTNGNQEITGANMQSTLISIINSLGTGYQFMGVATPSTSPGTPDYNVAYIGGAGTYANFGTSVTVPVGSICIFKYNGSWAKEQIALFAGIDDAPTAGSDNLVKSGGVANSILTLENNVYNIIKDEISELSVSNTYSSYRLKLDNNNNVVTSSTSTDVRIFDVGANKSFKVSGTCSIVTPVCGLLSGRTATSAAPYVKLYDSDGSGIFTFYGKTSSTQTYVAITVDKNTTYSCKITEDIDIELENIQNEVNGMLPQLIVPIYPAQISNSYSSYRLKMDNNNNVVTANSTTDVIIFNVGINKSFRVKGYCSTVTPVCGLFSGYSATTFAPYTKLYDSDGSGSYTFDGETTSTQQYVAITVDKNTSYSCSITEGVGLAVENIQKKVNNVISILNTDTELEILSKFIDAYTMGNCDVVFEKGTYTFAEVYIYMRDTLGWTWTMELPIGNNCRYFFNGSTLISNPPAETYETSRNILGCKAGANNNSNFELHDGILINNGGTYCVHDECTNETHPYIHIYSHIRMIYNNGTRTENLSKCIGGGAGLDAYIKIEECVFESYNSLNNTDAISWHGKDRGTAVTPLTSFSLYIENSYILNDARIGGVFVDGDTIFCKYSGNSAARDLVIGNDVINPTLVKFNNEIRE